MNSENKAGITQSKFLKLLKKNVKRVIAEQGIDTMTRKGDKELDLLVKKMVKHPIQTQEEASQIGERLGGEIVEMSRQQGKTNLDKSVIRRLATQKQLSLSYTVTPPETPTIPLVAKSVPQTSTPVTQETATTSLVAEESVLKLELASSVEEFEHTTETLDLSVDSYENSATEDIEELEEEQLLPS